MKAFFVPTAACAFLACVTFSHSCVAADVRLAGGSETLRAQDGRFLGTIDWGHSLATSQGVAFCRPESTVGSPEYRRAASRARDQALTRLSSLVYGAARLHQFPVEASAVRSALDRARVLDRDYDPASGQLMLTVALNLSGRLGALSTAAAAPSNFYDPYARSGDTVSYPRAVPVSASIPPVQPQAPAVMALPPAVALAPAAPVSTAPAAPVEVAQLAPPAPQYGSLTVPAVGIPATPEGQQGPFTGVVIDCRGLGLLSSMSPKIRTGDGKEVWGTVHVGYDFAETVGIAGFMEDWDKALAYDQRVGTHPLILRATGCAGGRSRSDAILTDADATRLIQEDAHSHFLGKYKVMFVVDPLRQ